tara:strand:+ start:385 stop:606 length:222 start_codon:yes stop_codon:yes gene_type:complete
MDGAILCILDNNNNNLELLYMNDDRYIIEEYDGGVRITMKIYKEWVAENGKPQVFHKTDTVGFKSPLVKEDYE